MLVHCSNGLLDSFAIESCIFVSRILQEFFFFSDFVDIHYADLVDRVTSVMPIADKLLEKKMLPRQMYSKIRATDTSEDQMRTLLEVVTSGGPAVQSYFYEVLQLNEPFLVQDLESKSEN